MLVIAFIFGDSKGMNEMLNLFTKMKTSPKAEDRQHN